MPENNIQGLPSLDHGPNFAAIGMFIAFFAFALSATTPWVLEHYAPPEETIEEIAVKKALSLKEKIVSSFFGAEESQEKTQEQEVKKEQNLAPNHWTDYWSLMVMIIALGGMFNGLVGFMQKQNAWVCSSALCMGTMAIMFQYLWISLGIIILLALITALFATFGGAF